MAKPLGQEEEVDEAAEVAAANAAPVVEVDEAAELAAANSAPPPVPVAPEKPKERNLFQRLLLSPEFQGARDVAEVATNPFANPVLNPMAPFMGKAEDAARGALDGFYSGFSDELVGGISSRFPSLNRTLGDVVEGKPAPRPLSYTEARDEQRMLMDDAARNSPATYYGAGFAGALAAPNPLPRVGMKFAPKMGGVLTQGVANAAANGAISGGINALGNSDAELASDDPDISGTLANVGTGAVAGGVFGGAMTAGAEALGRNDRVPRFIEYLRGNLENAAERRAVKAATGQNQAFWKAEENKGRINAIGRTLLDQGIVTAGASQDEIRRGVERLAEESGQSVGDTLRRLDAAARPGQQIDVMADIGMPVFDEVVRPINLGPVAQRAAADRVVKEVGNLADNVAMEVPNTPAPGRNVLPAWRAPTRTDYSTPMPLTDANRFKSQLDAAINWDSAEPPPTQEAMRQMRGIINSAIEGRAEEISRSAGARARLPHGVDQQALEDSRLFQQFMDAKKTYGEMAPLLAPSLQESIRQDSNRWFSPSDYGMAMSGGLVGSLSSGGSPMSTAMMGAAMGGLNKLARARGPQVAAAGMDALAQSPAMTALGNTTPADLTRVAGMVDAPATFAIGKAAGNAVTPDTSNSPSRRASSPEGQRFYRQVTTSPAVFGPWSKRLQQAASNGPEALSMQDYLLAADPAYVELRKRAAQADGGERVGPE